MIWRVRRIAKYKLCVAPWCSFLPAPTKLFNKTFGERCVSVRPAVRYGCFYRFWQTTISRSTFSPHSVLLHWIVLMCGPAPGVRWIAGSHKRKNIINFVPSRFWLGHKLNSVRLTGKVVRRLGRFVSRNNPLSPPPPPSLPRNDHDERWHSTSIVVFALNYAVANFILLFSNTNFAFSLFSVIKSGDEKHLFDSLFYFETITIIFEGGAVRTSGMFCPQRMASLFLFCFCDISRLYDNENSNAIEFEYSVG